jgi:hypothetical protein
MNSHSRTNALELHQISKPSISKDKIGLQAAFGEEIKGADMYRESDIALANTSEHKR